MANEAKPSTTEAPPPADLVKAPPAESPAATQTLPSPEPVIEKKPVEQWAKLKGTHVEPRRGGHATTRPHWLHDAAIIANCWAQLGTMLTEAEYDAGLKAAGDTPLGYGARNHPDVK